MADHVVLVAPNVSQKMGGEAIKVYQLFRRLHRDRPNVSLITHARCRAELRLLPEASEIHFIKDDFWQRAFWRSKILRFLLNPYFHLKARRYIARRWPAEAGVVLHYVCPISPVELRFPPSGYRLILGPLNGNIRFPPGFAGRERRADRLQYRLHGPVQRLLRLTGEKRKYDSILVSGHERTRVSLRLAGAVEARMIDVADSGVSEDLAARPRILHEGRNARFMCAGRLIDLKGFDLAIRAVAKAGPPISLDIYGEGPCAARWRQLAEELGVSDRVAFHGWCHHAELIQRMCQYRGQVFPTLREANGISMQEAMMAGLPVIALRWGGPVGLADDDAAIFIDPKNEDHVVDCLADAMDRLAQDCGFAERLSRNGRAIAKRDFTWSSVIASWTTAY